MVPSQDHKRAFDGDEGPNTGGMGAYAPAPVVTPAMLRTIKRDIIDATVRALHETDGTVYRGVLYAGLMITEEGPRVIEFNCRFGDPEAQVTLPLLEADIVEVMVATARGELDPSVVKTSSGSAVCVVMASGGYPGSYEKGKVVGGLASAGAFDDVVVFHAGTAERDGDVVTSGGRVLGVTGVADDLPELGARGRARREEGERHDEGDRSHSAKRREHAGTPGSRRARPQGRVARHPAHDHVLRALGRRDEPGCGAPRLLREEAGCFVSEIPAAVKDLEWKLGSKGLSYVLRTSDRLPTEVTAGTGTVAVRVERNEVVLEVLSQLAVPIVAPSANIEGADPPRRVDEAIAPLRDWIEVVVRWYPATATAASTIVDLTGDEFSIIREGTVPAADVGKVLGR
jgi:hypothetical protein